MGTTYLHAVASAAYVRGLWSRQKVLVVFAGESRTSGRSLTAHLMLEDPDLVIQGDGVLHVRYPVHRGS